MNNPDHNTACDCYDYGLQYICCLDPDEPPEEEEEGSTRLRCRITGEILS